MEEIPIDPEALETMRKRGGTWAAYMNQELFMCHDSTDGQCLQYGPGRTHETPPPHLHDGPWGSGWKYRLIGLVDLEKGVINANS